MRHRREPTKGNGDSNKYVLLWTVRQNDEMMIGGQKGMMH
jgi:hypothetical protein